MEDKKLIKEKCKFSPNELVLCYDPDPLKARMLYDAKILDVDLTKDEKGKKVCEYYIHFQGWNKSWDRWILEEHILKDTEVNRTLQGKLLKDAIKPRKRNRKITKGEGQSDDSREEESKQETSTKLLPRPGTSNDPEEEVKVIQLPPVSLDIPKALANRLEDDCYNIKRRKKLIHLPRKPSVNEILLQFSQHCSQPDGRGVSMKIVEELLEGLNTYFNFFLHTLLLYNFEREQYLKFFPQQNIPSHLLALRTSTPPVTPILSPQVLSLAHVEKNLDSNPSSRSSSRSSSFSEDIPLSHTVRKRGRERKHISDNTPSEKLEPRRKRGVSSSSETASTSDMGLVAIGLRHPNESIESTNQRETRSTRSASKNRMEEIVIKKEPIDYAKENEKALISPVGSTNGKSTGRLRRSNRGMKGEKSVELHALPMYPKPKASHQELKELKKPLTIQTDLSKVETTEDRSFMMFPLRPVSHETPADVYGIEHLLRLFVKLPVLLASSNIQKEKLDTILTYVGKLLEYLSKRPDLFCDDVYSESVL